MASPERLSGRKLATIATFSLLGGIGGVVAGGAFGSVLRTSPAWIGPAIFIGSIGLLIIGLLLLPAALRASKSSQRRPAA